ncbi:hypothetical protein ACIBEA_29905 [Streptomyces sp. NPDC051555]|uniref:hypothetical protein n=1 Tax=Streptomyces sp. NPDC051555 TaxID=3365657 RepID=UPI0037B8426B
MGKVFSNTTRGIRDFEQWLGKGKTVYVINVHADMPGQFDRNTYSAHKCTGRHPILGGWEMGSNISAKGFIQQYKQVFENPPPGLRDLASPEPDCRDEGYGMPRGWENETRRLDRDEIAYMEKLSGEAADQYGEDRKAGRRKWGFR